MVAIFIEFLPRLQDFLSAVSFACAVLFFLLLSSNDLCGARPVVAACSLWNESSTVAVEQLCEMPL